MKYFKKLAAAVLALGLLSGCLDQQTVRTSGNESVSETETPVITQTPDSSGGSAWQPEPIDEDGIYDTRDEVALYLYTYHHLPSNYMTKKEARKQGWDGGALNRTIKGKCIGGDVYGNYEGALPEISGKYYECDIDTLNRKKRGSKRLIWSDDYQIYYTEDHYQTFEQWIEGEWQ